MKTRFTAPLRARRGDPKGQVLVLFALMLVVLLLVSALAVDYGGWLVTKRHYQNISDAASLAGAQQLTRPLTTACPSGATKNFCARQAAWESVKAALGLTILNPIAQSAGPGGFSKAYVEKGYSIWVASPPTDAGTAYVGRIGGPGNVYVRIDHAGQDFLSRIANTNRTVAAWSTAGRFPANFAVIGMCSPTSFTFNCGPGDSNIKLDGTNANLIINTGDLGTNRWTRSGGGSSGVALGADGNAYMQLFDSCWNATGNQCNLFGYSGGTINTSDIRSAIPLGAPIPDPQYAAPFDNTNADTRVPNQCRGSGAVQLASVKVIEQHSPNSVADLPIALAAAREPVDPGKIVLAATSKVTGTVLWGGSGVNNMTVEVMNGAAVVKGGSTGATGAFSINGVTNGNGYTIRVTDNNPGGPVYHTYTTPATFNLTADYAAPAITIQKNPVVSGTVTSSSGGAALNNVAITITAFGTPYTTTTNASGFYTKIIEIAGGTVAYTIDGTLPGYVPGGTTVSTPTGYDTNYPNKNFTLTPAPGSVTGTITDAVTSLPVPGVVVTLSSGESATTDASGFYNIASTSSGAKTIALSGTAMTGYAYSTPSSGSSITVSGATPRSFTLWPYGCDDSSPVNRADTGTWSCSYPSNHCPSTTDGDGGKPDAADVTCAFTQANAIRPGTYKDIRIDGCAWIDPKGGVTGLAAGQSAGVVYVTGTLDLAGSSFLFGDGVTIVLGTSAQVNIGNDGGFVLNYGTTDTGYLTPYYYGGAGTPCFRTVGCAGQDYAYAAWTTKGTGHAPWSCTVTTPPTYDTSCVQKGQELGITWYLYAPPGTSATYSSRFHINTGNMGYLFNGVLYGPRDDIKLGGGHDAQTAAGQIVGWTIEYNGGTRILQNWYGDPQDGQPFLIEPILGE